APAGWMALAERFGTRPLGDLARPAIRLARDGIERSRGLDLATQWSTPLLADDPDAARIFLASDRLVQTELGGTLESLSDFYRTITPPPPFTRDDFVAHRAAWVEP